MARLMLERVLLLAIKPRQFPFQHPFRDARKRQFLVQPAAQQGPCEWQICPKPCPSRQTLASHSADKFPFRGAAGPLRYSILDAQD